MPFHNEIPGKCPGFCFYPWFKDEDWRKSMRHANSLGAGISIDRVALYAFFAKILVK